MKHRMLNFFCHVGLAAGSLALALLPSASAAQTSATPLPRWHLAGPPSVLIGETEGSEEYVFSQIVGVRLLPDGGVVVADGASSTIRIYDAGGRWMRQMGRAGQGPGEFTFLSALYLVGRDTVLAFDPAAMRLSRFLVSGSLVSTIQLQATTGRPEVLVAQLNDGGYAAAWIVRRPPPNAPFVADLMEVGRFGKDGRLSTVFATAAGMRRTPMNPLPFSGHFLAASYGDTLYLTDGMAGRLAVVPPNGAEARSIQLPLPTLDVRNARRRLEATLENKRYRAQLDELAGVPGTDSVPTVSDMFVDDQGLLWLKRYDPATDSHWVVRKRTGGEWLVMRRDGSPVAAVIMPQGFRPMDVCNGVVAGVVTDELGVERVAGYAIQRR